jgi:hypothetical protein
MLAVHRDVSPRKVALMRRYSTIALASTGAAVTTIDSFEDEAAAENVFHAGVQKSGLPIKLLHMKALEALNILVSVRVRGGEECVHMGGWVGGWVWCEAVNESACVARTRMHTHVQAAAQKTTAKEKRLLSHKKSGSVTRMHALKHEYERSLTLEKRREGRGRRELVWHGSMAHCMHACVAPCLMPARLGTPPQDILDVRHRLQPFVHVSFDQVHISFDQRLALDLVAFSGMSLARGRVQDRCKRHPPPPSTLSSSTPTRLSRSHTMSSSCRTPSSLPLPPRAGA